jgi:hypothetical protein
MNRVVKTHIVLLPALLFAVLSIASCSSTPQPQQHDPWNSAESQKSGAKQTQDEMSKETSR